MNLRIVFKLILCTKDQNVAKLAICKHKSAQAKNVAETVTALMTNLAIAAAVDLVVVVAVVGFIFFVWKARAGQSLAR